MKIYLGLVLSFMLLIGGNCLADSAMLQSSMQPIGNGEIRYMGFIKVYDASLSASRMVNGGEILDTEISKCLILSYAVPLTVDKFISGAEKVLQRQHSEEALRSVQHHIDSLHAQYRDVQEGDSYTLCYDATSSTTTLSLNQEKLASIVSPDFAKFYFGIWLGSDAPLDEGLRDNLLAINR